MRRKLRLVKVVRPAVNSCSLCGDKVVFAYECPVCKTYFGPVKNPDNHKYCEVCGSELDWKDGFARAFEDFTCGP